MSQRGFRIIVAGDHEAMSRLAADQITAVAREHPGMLLCGASGSTPTRAYDLLGERAKESPLLFDRLRLLKLDEWVGLPLEHPANCESYMRRHLVGPLGITEERYFSFQDGVPAERECERIRLVVEEQGPVDVMVLGLGTNGHIGFNEPATELQAHAHRATLSRSSRDHDTLGEQKGTLDHGLTLGMTDIMRARRVLLVVSGATKRRALLRLVTGGISTRFPASFLRMHPDAVCLCDRAAAALLSAAS